MDIVKILIGAKGKVLDSAHFELLKHAYELQEQNISQLKTNNTALKESNELLKERSKVFEEKVHQLEEDVCKLKAKIKTQTVNDNEVIKLSKNATKIFEVMIKEDVTDFYHNAIIDVMNLGRINTEAALDELLDYGLIEALSAHKGYGLHYNLTTKAKKALTEQ